MVNRSLVVAVAIGIGILFAASMYAAVWIPIKRRKRSLPELLASINKLRSEASLILDQHPQRLDSALEKSFERYARHSLIMEGISADDVTINSIRAATDFVINHFKWGEITENQIRTVHAHIMHLEDPSTAGQFRNYNVGIKHRDGFIAKFPNHEDVPNLMTEFITWLNRQEDTVENRLLIAAEAKLRYVSIHPHADGNGRTSRAIMVGLLRQIPVVPYVTIPHTMKEEYFSVLRQARETEPDPIHEDFVKFILALVENEYENFNKDLSLEEKK